LPTPLSSAIPGLTTVLFVCVGKRLVFASGLREVVNHVWQAKKASLLGKPAVEARIMTKEMARKIR
jgi:hypothetical protein